MTTPTKQEIVEEATRLYFEDCYRHGCQSPITPEVEELRESGFLSLAQSLLMRDRTRHTAEEWQDYTEQTEKFAEFQFNVPEAMKSGCYVSGTTGTGKSDVGMYSAEALMEHGIIILVFDSTQDWQNRSSIETVETLRTPYIREIPQASRIFDISLLKVLERQQLIERFCGDIYRYQAMKKASARRQYFLVFEESHNYFKEGFMRAKRFSNSAMLLSEGRNYGIRFMCITQFASLLDKTAMKYMRLRYFGYTSEPNDCEYVSRFFPRQQREEIETKLRNLKAGQFLNMQSNIVSIEPFESEVVKREITSTAPQILTKITTQPKADYGAISKFLIISAIGIAFLLGAR